jgi:hypothetical protein
VISRAPRTRRCPRSAGEAGSDPTTCSMKDRSQSQAIKPLIPRVVGAKGVRLGNLDRTIRQCSTAAANSKYLSRKRIRICDSLIISADLRRSGCSRVRGGFDLKPQVSGTAAPTWRRVGPGSRDRELPGAPSPVEPSTASRSRSSCPVCRAYSSIMSASNCRRFIPSWVGWSSPPFLERCTAPVHSARGASGVSSAAVRQAQSSQSASRSRLPDRGPPGMERPSCRR